MGSYNASSKFKSEILVLSNKQDAEFKIVVLYAKFYSSIFVIVAGLE